MLSKLRSNGSSNIRFGWNFLGYGYAQIVTLILQFVQIPIFLFMWGKNEYADWIVLTSTFSVFAILDFGVAGASANKASISASGGDWDATRKTLQTAFVFSMAVATMCVLCAGVLSVFISWDKLLKLKTLTHQETNFTFIVLAVYLGIQLLGGGVEAWFRAIDKTALGAFLLANRRMLDFFCSLVVLYFKGGIVELSVFMCIVQSIFIVICIVIADNISPFKIKGLKEFSWGELRSVVVPSMANLGIIVAQVATIQGSVQLINQFAGAVELIAFTMSRTMMRIVLQIGVIVNNALKAEVTRLIGKGKEEQARKLASMLGTFTIGIGFFLYFLFITTGKILIGFWSHGRITVTYWFLAFVGLHALLNLIWYIKSTFTFAINAHGRISLLYGLSSIISCIYWFVFSMGMTSPERASLMLATPEFIVLGSLMYVFFLDKEMKN